MSISPELNLTLGDGSGADSEPIKTYLFLLDERLRYMTTNLGAENFNPTSLSEIGETIRKPLTVRLEDTDGRLSELSTRLGSITLRVENGEASSVLRLMAGETVLASAEIKLSGVVTFEDLSTSGNTVISGDNITTGKLVGLVIEAGIFRSRLTSSGDVEGRVVFEYEDGGTPAEVGGLYVDDRGEGTGESGKYRVFLYSGKSGERAFALKLLSAADMSLESVGNMWISAGGSVNIGAPDGLRIAAGTPVYIGNETLEEYVKRIASAG